ncbi:hypothetical protein, partial [Thermoleptolyngbya sp. M55_K2018_002]|uniref:hypothetical protein n=1 Tax=Thermoleptolyngbya sp. M55_K2018_002 TaxID=2747808 RepID=UPI0025D05844
DSAIQRFACPECGPRSADYNQGYSWFITSAHQMGFSWDFKPFRTLLTRYESAYDRSLFIAERFHSKTNLKTIW